MSLQDFLEQKKIENLYTHPISSPGFFFILMFFFVTIIFLIGTSLFDSIYTAFITNPWLNGFILSVLLIGIFLSFKQVIRLFHEIRWVNCFQKGETKIEPVLLLPIKVLLTQSTLISFSASSMQTMLDSISNRLDENRNILRYLVGLLVFLGLLGTFWGLLETIHSIKNTINALHPNFENPQDMLLTLKKGLSEPLSGMATAFSSSLFGLSGSLILGFLDLQAGQAQNRFYTELENWLSTEADLSWDISFSQQKHSPDISILLEKIQNIQKSKHFDEQITNSIDHLSENIKALIKNMLNEQQMVRIWMEAESKERVAIKEEIQKIGQYIQQKRSI